MIGKRKKGCFSDSGKRCQFLFCGANQLIIQPMNHSLWLSFGRLVPCVDSKDITTAVIVVLAWQQQLIPPTLSQFKEAHLVPRSWQQIAGCRTWPMDVSTWLAPFDEPSGDTALLIKPEWSRSELDVTELWWVFAPPAQCTADGQKVAKVSHVLESHALD